MVVADNDAEVFAGTVRDVVAGRLEPDDDRIRAALHTAVAEDVVEALPGGLDAPIAAGGSDLSGGQRQRIRLARAVYAAPDVLLAVDPTSAVDANTEAAMIDRLREARRDPTTVVTTTSPLVLDRADEVIVLVDGRVVRRDARGTPAQRPLLSRPGIPRAGRSGGPMSRRLPVAGPPKSGLRRSATCAQTAAPWSGSSWSTGLPLRRVWSVRGCSAESSTRSKPAPVTCSARWTVLRSAHWCSPSCRRCWRGGRSRSATGSANAPRHGFESGSCSGPWRCRHESRTICPPAT